MKPVERTFLRGPLRLFLVVINKKNCLLVINAVMIYGS